MSNIDQLLWRAIGGALGTEKRAFLQNSPLPEVLGADSSFALPHAIGASISSKMHKQAEAKSIQSGLEALAMVAKEASISPRETFTEKVSRSYKIRTLEPYLSGGEKQAAARTRRTLNVEIMDTVKQAGVGTALSGIISNPALREGAKKMMGGAALAGGAALPVYAVGSALSDKFTEDSRNRALQTAAGVTGLGLAGYGAKKLMDQAAQDRTRTQNYDAMGQMKDQDAQRHKDMIEFHRSKASHEKIAVDVYAMLHLPEEKVAHMATCVYLDGCLASVEQTAKTASLRELNGEFLTELLATTVKMSEDSPIMAIKKNLDAADRAKASPAKRKKMDAGKPVSQPKRTYTPQEVAGKTK